jgi:hypothetical protein
VTTASSPASTATWQLSCHELRLRVEGPRSALAGLRRRFVSPPGWQDCDSPVVEGSIRVERMSGGRGGYRVLVDGAAYNEPKSLVELPPRLDRAIVTTALDVLGRSRLLFHAGAVAHEGRGVILPASPGSGKSTLVAGLVSAGYGYLSDEVAIIDAEGEELLPFARNPCLKPGARELLESRFPRLASSRAYRGYNRQPVTFMTLRKREWAAKPVMLSCVVFPRYTPGARTELVELSRSEALEKLVAQAFNLPAHGGEGMAGVVRLVRSMPCFRLVVGDLDAAIETVGRALERAG